MSALDIASFRGIRGLANYVSGERPESWREGILYNDIDGEMPLTGLLSKMDSEMVDDDTFHWFTENTPEQAGDVTAGAALYDDPALSVVVSGGETAGTVVYAKVPLATAQEFVAGKLVSFRVAADSRCNTRAIVLAVEENGASSYLKTRLLEDDDNSPDNDLTDVDRVVLCGNAYEDGSMPPDSINYQPYSFENYTQLFRNTWKATARTLSTNTRTRKNQRRDGIKSITRLHGMEMEKAFFDGVPFEGTGEGGQRFTTTAGVDYWIANNAPNNIFDFRYDTDFAGYTWEDGGEPWLDKVFEIISRYGKMARFCPCGSLAQSGLNTVAKAHSKYELMPGAKAYGIEVRTFANVHLTLDLVKHPLMTLEPTRRNRMYVLSLRDLKYRYLKDQDTNVEEVTPKGFKGEVHEITTDCGLEFHHPSRMAILDGIGQDNLLTP
jgi:hypothetical protein